LVLNKSLALEKLIHCFLRF